MNATQRSALSRVGSGLLRLAISLVILLLLFRFAVDPAEVGGRLKTAIARHPGALAQAFLFYCVLGTLVRGRRWQALVSGLGLRFTAWRATELFLVGTFFNQFLPTGIGGDVVRALAAARDGLGLTRAFSSVLVDRALGMLPMLAIGLYALPSVWGHLDPRLRLPMLLIGGLGLVGLLALLRIERAAGLASRGLARLLPARLQAAIDRLLSACTEYDGASLGRALGWGTVFALLLIGTNAALGRAVGIELPGLSDWAIVVPMVAISSILPSIGGWGIREALYASVLAGQADAAVALSMLFGLLNVLLAAVGGVLTVMGESIGLPRLAELRRGQAGGEGHEGPVGPPRDDLDR